MNGKLIFLWIIQAFLCCLTGVSANREDECSEVGFARATFNTVDQSFKEAKDELVNAWKEEDEKGVPSYANVSPSVKNVTRAALLLEQTSKNIIALIRKTRVGKRCPPEWLLKGVERHVTPLIQMDKEFAESLGLVMAFKCLVGSPYPNVDGTCINEEGPDIGAIGSKFLRLIPPVSGKGGFGLRSSVSGDKSLPSARKVAQLIRRHLATLPVSAFFVELAQFLAQDSVSIPESALAENVDCCSNSDHPECAAVFVDEDDPLFETLRCFNLKRSIPAQAILGHRESLTAVSTYLDATPVYGPTNEVAFKLKEGYFGLLKTPSSEEDEGGKDAKRTVEQDCQFPTSFKGCFDIDTENGDFLENLRLLLILEHNQIAESLAEINPHFDDALLYNEARRILIAEYNAIVYGEYVPILVGKETAVKHALLPGSEGPGAKFIPEVTPGILTSHAFASYRNPAMVNEWKSAWGKTDILSSLHYDSVRKESYQDFLAVDVQKGRDHGLTSYTTWRAFCDSGRQINSWEDMEDIFSKMIIDELREIYQDEVRDVDMLLSLLEKSDEGFAGKISSCILVDQFARLKTGNRLYWEHESSMLTPEQRDVIRSQSSAASLLCRHLGLERVAKDAFLKVSDSNPEVECSTFTKLDLSPWKDTSLIELMEQKKKEEEEQKKKEEEEKKKEEEEKKKQDEEEKAKLDEEKRAEEEQKAEEKKEQEIKVEAAKVKREEMKKEEEVKQEKEKIEAKRKREKDEEHKKVKPKSKDKIEL